MNWKYQNNYLLSNLFVVNIINNYKNLLLRRNEPIFNNRLKELVKGHIMKKLTLSWLEGFLMDASDTLIAILKKREKVASELYGFLKELGYDKN